MNFLSANPLVSPVAIFVVALSLSIGWGIRGNYGHETGAMLPGALAAIAVCLMSGREDWRRRVAYFAFFGALGWGFGGSMSYSQIIAYTHSGQYESQLYGFYCLFAMGFLWAALGGAGTALPAVLDHRKLGGLVFAFLPLLALWVLMYAYEETPIPEWIEGLRPSEESATSAPAETSDLAAVDARAVASATAETEKDKMDRHEHPTYWLDTDWVSVGIILVGILLFDLLTRRFSNLHMLVVIVALTTAVGAALHYGVQKAGYEPKIIEAIVHVQGDVNSLPENANADQLLTNWPPVLSQLGDRAGWVIGIVVGILLYFAIYGEFRHGSLMYFYMAVGWIVGFLALSVLADIRMTPPRGDNWAGLAGMTAALWLYFLRDRLWPVLLVSIVCGVIGGIGFSGAAWLKLWLLSNGNPNLELARFEESSWHSFWWMTEEHVRATTAGWTHFQRANWHSFLEQTYGFVNGIGVAIAMALIVRRAPAVPVEAPRRRWAEVFCVFFVLVVMVYVNMVKNLNEWTELHGGFQALPSTMKMPFVEWIELSAWTWFTILFWIVAAGVLLLGMRPGSRGAAILPENWLGRGELLYFVLLWVFVLGNFAKALAQFQEGRLLTEGVILIHAAVATVLLFAFAPRSDDVLMHEKSRYAIWIALSIAVGAALAYVVPLGQTMHIRHIYGDTFAGHSGVGKPHLRFGKDADWRARPNLRNVKHR